MTRKTNTESNQRLDADPTLREIALDAVAIELGKTRTSTTSRNGETPTAEPRAASRTRS